MARIAKDIRIDEPTRLALLGAGDGNLYVKCLSIGQGDCTFIVSPNGKRMMIDCGTTRADDEGQMDRLRALLPMVDGQLPVEVVVMTHSDSDHYNKFGDVIGSGPVDVAYYSGELQYYKSLAFRQWWYGSGKYSSRAAAVKKQVPLTINKLTDPAVEILDGGGGCKMTALASNVEDGGDPTSHYAINTRSIVVRTTFSGSSLLFCGDATCTTESFLIRKYGADGLGSYFMRIPHHGSSTSSSSAFIAAVSPLIGVISAAKYNRYDLPRKTVVDRYLEKVSPVGDEHYVTFYKDPKGTECQKKVEDAIRPMASVMAGEVDATLVRLDMESIRTTRKLYNTGDTGTYELAINGSGVAVESVDPAGAGEAAGQG